MFLQVSPLAKQVWTISSVLLFNAGCGMMVDQAQTPFGIALIESNPPITADIPITSFLESTPLHITVGLISSAILMHWYGRRAAFLATTFTAIIGWLITYLANSALTFAIGRTLGDFTNCPGIILGAIVIGEYTSPIYRRMFLTLASGSLAFGKMTAHFIGNWSTLAVFALVLNMLSLAITWTWPDSPAWLASRQRYDDCRTSFISLGRTSLDEKEELTTLIQVQKELAVKNRKFKIFGGLRDLFTKLTRRNFVKPIVIITFASVLLEASGINVFETYGSHILAEIFGTPPSFHYALCINIIVTSSIIVTSVLEKVLKRTVIFITGCASVIVLFTSSVILFFMTNNVLPVNPWIIIAMLTSYLILINLGCTVIFLTWCGELFPLHCKSVGLVISGIVFSLNKSIFLKMAPYLLTGLKLYGTLGISTVILTLVLMTLYFIAPDTKNKTLSDIERYFNNESEEEYDEVNKHFFT